MTREAARAIGTWLEGRGGLHQPNAALTALELEAMAMNAISAWWCWGMERINRQPADAGALIRFLLADSDLGPVRAARPWLRLRPPAARGTAFLTIASVRCAVLRPRGGGGRGE